VGQGSTR